MTLTTSNTEHEEPGATSSAFGSIETGPLTAPSSGRPEPVRVEAPRGEANQVGRPARPVRKGRVVLVWLVVFLVAAFLVLYALEPLFQQDAQNRLMDEYTTEIEQAVNETSGLGGVTAPRKPPAVGSPVGIVEIPGIRLRQVVVEGVGADQTQMGPGHVPGTAAPGQPGNSAIVGRRAMFGGPFDRLGELVEGDLILVTTTQGQVVYAVDVVATMQVVPAPDDRGSGGLGSGGLGSGGLGSAMSTPPTTTVAVGGTGGGEVSETSPVLTDTDELYGPTEDDRLTLVTSASAWPTNSTSATVVTASLQGLPYEPTPQAGRSDDQTGMTGESAAWPALLLAAQAFVLAVLGAVVLYRRSSRAVAYLLTTPPLVVFAIVMAEQISRLLPAWS